MKAKSVFAVLFLLFASLPLLAQPRTSARATDLFRAHEVSLDLFGSVSVWQETWDDVSGDRVRDDGRLGAGVGLNYFITRHVGIAADAYTEDTKGSFVDNASGNVVLRFPIEKARLAPYIFGGGGRQFDPEDLWFGQVGGGIDIRVTRHWGLFSDVRYVMLEDDADNVGLGRFGIRIPF